MCTLWHRKVHFVQDQLYGMEVAFLCQSRLVANGDVNQSMSKNESIIYGTIIICKIIVFVCKNIVKFA